MQAVCRPADLLEANLLVAMLAAEGIAAHIHGASLVGGIGELPALGLLSLWVEDEDWQRATDLVQAYEQALPCAEEFSQETGEQQPKGLLWC